MSVEKYEAIDPRLRWGSLTLIYRIIVNSGLFPALRLKIPNSDDSIQASRDKN